LSGIVLILLTVKFISLNGGEGSKTAFNMLVPMIGTWIDTAAGLPRSLALSQYFLGKEHTWHAR
jgi:hypothetical protein